MAALFYAVTFLSYLQISFRYSSYLHHTDESTMQTFLIYYSPYLDFVHSNFSYHKSYSYSQIVRLIQLKQSVAYCWDITVCICFISQVVTRGMSSNQFRNYRELVFPCGNRRNQTERCKRIMNVCTIRSGSFCVKHFTLVYYSVGKWAN